MNDLVFTKRVTSRYMVRFWTKPETYKAFTARVSEDGLIIAQVFTDFMKWFTNRPRAAVAQKEPTHE